MEMNEERGKNYGVEHRLAPFSGPLDDVLQAVLGRPLEQIQFLRNFGSIYVMNKRCLENLQISQGAYLRIHQNPRRFPTQLFQWPEQKVFENDDFAVLNKASGLPVPPTVDNFHENIAALASRQLQQTLHVTHRLDTATSGLLVLAKNKRFQSEFNSQLAEGKVQKTYRALVHGARLPLGEWEHFMEPSPRAPKVVSAKPRPGWSSCRLRLLSQKEIFPGRTEVLIELITGRTHQIRAQLAVEGHPIVGDLAYGSDIPLAREEKIWLQAHELRFPYQGQNLVFSLEQRPWAVL